MRTEYFSNNSNHMDTNALDQAIMRSMKIGNGSIHSILKDAQNVIAEQKARINELTRLATTDELTNILNRRGFTQVFERELDRIKRKKHNGTPAQKGGILLMIDLDSFKAINDTHGHAAGDAALKLVAKTLRIDIRKMDVAGRLGGDEFVVLFTNTTRNEAAARIQRLINTLNNLSFIWNSAEIDIRASVGVKQYDAGDKIGRVFSAADSDLYAEKEISKLELNFRKTINA